MDGPITIRRPEAPGHSMTLEGGKAQVYLEDRLVAESSEAVIVRETGRSPYPPVAYFPREALVEAQLVPVSRKTECPLKGTASYFDLEAGEARVRAGVWSYERVLGFDEGLSHLKGKLGFDAKQFRIEMPDSQSSSS